MDEAWDLFGSDSDGEWTPPHAVPAVSHAVPADAASKSMWEVLLPVFPEAREVFKGSLKMPVVAPFGSPPHFQAPCIRFEANMPHRGGGRGFVAETDINPGTLLIAEHQFLPMPDPEDCGAAGGMPPDELCLRWMLRLPSDRLLEAVRELAIMHPQSLDDLPLPERKDLIDRYAGVAKDMLDSLPPEVAAELRLDITSMLRLLCVFRSNGFSSGVYLHMAMTNHSCRICYLEPRELSRSNRLQRLSNQFGFRCQCPLCFNSQGQDAQLLSAFKFTDINLEEGAVVDVGDSSTSLGTGLRVVEEGEGEQAIVTMRRAAGGREVEGERGDTRDERGERMEGEEGEDDDLAAAGAEAVEILEERLEAVESVISLALENEVRWAGVLVEVLSFRRQAALVLAPTHISLARADKVISSACTALLQGSLEAAEVGEDCSSMVKEALVELGIGRGLTKENELMPKQQLHRELTGGREDDEGRPLEGGKCTVASNNSTGVNALPKENFNEVKSFQIQLLMHLLSSLLSLRQTQLLYLGQGPHPEAAACLADMAEALRMLLAYGAEGKRGISLLPGPHKYCLMQSSPACTAKGHTIQVKYGNTPLSAGSVSGGDTQQGAVTVPLVKDKTILISHKEGVIGGWFSEGGVGISASLLERECDKAARKIGRIFASPPIQDALA